MTWLYVRTALIVYKIINNLAMVLHSCLEKADKRTRKNHSNHICERILLITEPEHKKCDQKEAKKYRPIRKWKGLESIVSHMMTNNLFCDEQHGFVPGRSCVTQLLCVSLNSREEIDCIYLDFQKAFDTVPHARLISKSKADGIEGPLKRWITNFLSNHIQRVVVNNEMSTWSTISSGIPQGSVLGPTFFVVFINDIPDSINSTVNIFADDAKLFRSFTSTEEHDVLIELLLMCWQIGQKHGS